MSGIELNGIQPVDECVRLDSLTLRVLRWNAVPDPDRSDRRLPPFLLVHGLASNARLWDGMARQLARAGRSSVAVDLRGHGQSDKPDEGFDFETVSSDLVQLIGKLGLERPIVAGQSWGASVVLDLAVRRPDLLGGIVLVDGGLNDMRDAFPNWDDCWERLAPPQLVGLPLDAIEGYFRTNHADWAPEGLEGSLGNFDIRADRTIAPFLTRERHKLILHELWAQRPSELWPRLRVPALIVPVDNGATDWVAGKRGGVERALAAARASGTPVLVEWFEGDHDIHAQRPAELVSAILEAERSGLFGDVRVA
jgi:pimeloyl-ACP methyl ester carboxylesterase